MKSLPDGIVKFQVWRRTQIEYQRRNITRTKLVEDDETTKDHFIAMFVSLEFSIPGDRDLLSTLSCLLCAYALRVPLLKLHPTAQLLAFFKGQI